VKERQNERARELATVVMKEESAAAIKNRIDIAFDSTLCYSCNNITLWSPSFCIHYRTGKLTLTLHRILSFYESIS